MNLQTFTAPTMVEALAQVKGAMGHDAVILHTRTLSRRRWMGLRRREIVEITAGKGLNVPDRSRRSHGRPSIQPQNTFASRPGTHGLAFPAQPPDADRSRIITYGPAPVLRSANSLPEPPVVSSRQQFLESPAAGAAALLGLTEDITNLKSMVKDLVCEVRHKQAPQVPEELFEYYLHLVENQVADSIAMELIKTVREGARAEQLAQPDWVREQICKQLEKLIPVAGPIQRTKITGPHIVALIGPTGVGKTTTLAKLAANLKLRERRRVGLITLDTYRLAAIDQLKKYADIIRADLCAANSSEELRAAIASMAGCEFILIDTAGRSPNDTMKLGELRGLMDAAQPDEVHLVLSTTASESCVELALTRFSEVRVDKIIFTKLDEAAHLGMVLNVLRKVNKPLSYVTTGQDVPNDIEVGRGQRLAQMILGTT